MSYTLGEIALTLLDWDAEWRQQHGWPEGEDETWRFTWKDFKGCYLDDGIRKIVPVIYYA